METIGETDLKDLYLPPKSSHKGQNGRLLIIGGSHLFHAASLWALKVASRIVDLVHYSSVAENNELVSRLKEEFRDGIVVPRQEIEAYIEEDDAILIGPGMMRAESAVTSHLKSYVTNLNELDTIKDEGVQTMVLTNYLLRKYPNQQWVIDAGALQMMDLNRIPHNAILTPHTGEFAGLLERSDDPRLRDLPETAPLAEKIKLFANRYRCIALVKGEKDIACNGGDGDARICGPGECRIIEGGNAGMTKGGTGDVLAGLIAALATKNNPFLAASAGSFINKKAGDALFERVGFYFNASDLADEIPKVMKTVIGDRQT